MPTNTTYNPPNIAALTKTALLSDARGLATWAPAGSLVNLDFEVTDDMLLTGIWLVVNNGAYGDYAHLQVLLAGEVVAQFVTNWYTAPVMSEQFDIVYPAKLKAGLVLRLVYTSTGSSDVFLAANYKLHRVLV